MAEAARSPDILELKIKTLDAQEFAVHVNKNASVPDLKAKVAENGGCPVESQRLIYRGRVLKDDQTVSDYNIEDGHVLHLVARQPPPQNEEDDEGPPPLEELGQQDVTSHILGSIAIDGAEGIPNLDQILSSVFSTFGLPGGLPVPTAFGPLGQAVGAGAAGDVETRTIEMHFDIPNTAFAGQGFQPARAVPVAAPSRTPGQGARGRGDTLSIMSNFMRHLERRMQAHIDVLRQHGTAAPRNLPAPRTRAATTAAGGGATGASTSTGPSATNTGTEGGNAATPPVPAPPAAVSALAATGAQGGGQAPGSGRNAANASSRSALLAGLLGRAQTMLQQQADPLLSIMHERLANEGSIVDPGDRGSTQADLQIGGSLLQGLGALLLELGRATRSVNLNTEPGQAVVNAATPFYISNTGILQGLTNAPSAGVPLPQAPVPQVQVPNAVVLQVQAAPPAIPLQVPGTPAQVVFQLGPQQHGAPRAYGPGGIGVQIGDPQGGSQAVGPNGGVMMQLLPNGTLAPLQGGPPAGSIFVGSVPGNATTATLQQAYQGAQAAQQQQQQAQSQQVQNLLGSLLGAFMPPQGGPAPPPANGAANAPPAGASAGGERGGGQNHAAGGGNGVSGNAQSGGATGTAQQGQARQRAQPTGAPSGGQPPAGVDGAALMNLIGPVLQQLSGAGMNVNFAPGGQAGPQGAGGPQQQREGGSGQPGQQQQQAQGTGAQPQHSQVRFPAPAPSPGAPSGQPQQSPAVRSVTVTRNIAVPGGNVRTTTTTFAVPGQQPDSNPGGGNNPQSNTQGGRNTAGGTSSGQPASAAQNNGPGAPEATPGERGTGQQSDPSGSQANGGVSAAASPASGVGTQGRGEAATANEGKKEESQEKESTAVGSASGVGPTPEGSSGGRSAPMGLGGTGLQPLPPRSRRRPAPRSEQQGRDGLPALTQILQGGPAAGPSAPPRGTPPALGDIMGSVMQAMGGQGGAGGGLGGVLGQLINNPGVDQMMRQVMGDEGDGGEGDGPDLGNMMSRMMPMVAQMLGGGGGGGGGAARSAGVRQRQADRDEGWQEALSDEERARWEATIARDEAAQAGAGPQRPLSDAYLRGSPAKRQRTGLDGTAFLMQSAQSPGEVLESMTRSVRNELAKEGEAAFGEGSNEGLVSGVSGDGDLAQAYVSTLVEDAVVRAENDPDFGNGSKYPKTKEAATEGKKDNL